MPPGGWQQSYLASCNQARTTELSEPLGPCCPWGPTLVLLVQYVLKQQALRSCQSRCKYKCPSGLHRIISANQGNYPELASPAPSSPPSPQANRHTQFLFGYRRGVLEGKPLATLMAPHFTRRLTERLAAIAASSELLRSASDQQDDEGDGDLADELVVGLHCERLAFPAKLCLRKASGGLIQVDCGGCQARSPPRLSY